ncbi:MAG: chloride channel protein [Clostridia bacterium]|nr:chloride channel protein [Clostridia bacterium]
MKKTFLEETLLFVNIIKWAVLSTVTGLITGTGAAIFIKLLGWTNGTVQSYRYYFIFLPVALFLSSLVTKYLAQDTEGNGTDKVIEAVHKKGGKINLSLIPAKLTATIITLTGGGSAGKEGSCAEIGAGLASGISDIIKLNKEDRRKIVICGISAGFSTVFGTPVAGALFAIEVLVLGKVVHEVLFPSLVSAVIGFHVAKSLGIVYFHQTIVVSSKSTEGLFVYVMLGGLCFGLVALLMIEALKYSEKLADRIKIWKPFKGLIAGIILVLLTLVFSPAYLGLGIDTIESTVQGQDVALYTFLAKILFTVITLSMGGSGGILTPVFFIGVTAGSAFAQVFHMDTGFFAAIGLVSVLSGVANTPVAASVLAVEMFGPHISPYAAIACLVSYIASGHRSIYPSQVLGTTKSSSVTLPLMKDFRNLEEIQTEKRPEKVINMLNKTSSKDQENK